MNAPKHNPQPQLKRGSPPGTPGGTSSEVSTNDEGELQGTTTNTDENSGDGAASKATVEEQEAITQAARVVKTPEFVTVMIIESVPSCTIGGQLYSFRAGTPAKVPADVARHLRNVRIAE